ncbi:TonB-dependent receptor [Rhodohalobacter mucosus]|uniref:TonB-dependent receptor n=1 Tax=Rhodohalobacter mucosus TaxID=2079485 RepID=UPI0013050081|nr:TonB-dependent receptor plug domain-containing protein [Rhodohalobacter mucosus]
MKKTIAIALSVIFYTLTVQAVQAQDGALLRVLTLNGEDGTPLIGATVILEEPGSEQAPELFCISDRDGLCEIRNVPVRDELELRISYVGFEPYTELLTFAGGERKIIRAVLNPAVGEIGELTVIEQRYITTGEVGVQRITSRQISRTPSPVAGGDLATFLQTVPGVITSGDRGGDLYIRGGTPDQNLVLVDNMPIVKPFHISNLFSAFPDDLIQDADLFSGGFSPKFNDATSAVLDIALRPGNMRDHRAAASVSPYMTALQAEGPFKTDRSSFLLSGRYSLIDRTGSSLTGEDQNIRFGDFTGRYTIQGENITCSITGLYTYDSGEIVPLRNVDHKWTNVAAGARCLGYSEFFSHPFNVSAGYTRYANEEGSPGQRERFSSIGQVYLKVDIREQLMNLPVDLGFSFNLKSYSVELDERFSRFISLESVNRKMPVTHMYLATEWEPATGLTFYPGVSSQFTLDMPITFEPRIRISWQPGQSDRSQLSLAAGRYVQTHSGISDERDAGTVFMVYQPVEIDNPLPSSLHGMIGVNQRLGNFLSFNAEGYVKQHDNVPVSKWNPEPRIEIETARAEGLTFGADVKMMLERSSYYATISYGWSKSEYEAVSGDLGAWVEEPVFSYSPAHDQRHKLNVAAGFELAGFNLDTRWEFGSGKPYTEIFGYDFFLRLPFENPKTDPGQARILFSEPYNGRMPTYHRLDVSLSRDIQLKNGLVLETQAGAINLYNRSNIFNFDYSVLQRVDQSPFFPYVSLRLVI